MPKVWADTIEGHRVAVRRAVLAATARLVEESGVLSVTMTRIAEQSGIGRATLYKYFSGLEEVLMAWHEAEVATHLEHVSLIARQSGAAIDRLPLVLTAYASMAHQHHGSEISMLLHRGDHVRHAEDGLICLLSDLLGQAVAEGHVRDDVPVDELAVFCVHALDGAHRMGSKAAVRRLVDVTLGGVRRQD